MLTSSTFQLLLNHSLNLQELYLSRNNIVLLSLHYPNFPSLEIFDVSFNNLTSLIFQENFNFSSKLQELDLSGCSLTDKSFLVLSDSNKKSLSSLVTLELGSNLLKSTIFHWIFNFTANLRSLNLGENLLEGTLPEEFGEVMNSLEVLVLESNELHGEIPTSLGNICTLKELYLGKSSLSGEISAIIQNSSWCNRHVLQILNLQYNQFTGMLPNLSIFTTLRFLDLSNNRLTGEIPKSIGLLHDLQYLHLDGNYFEGDIIESHLTNLSKLLGLELSDNSLSLKFGTNWVPPFQIFNLGLASCKLGPSFPSWLQTQKRLSFLDISKNKISDLNAFLCGNKETKNMGTLDLSNNQITGQLPNCWEHLRSLKFLDLSNNKLSGKIPQSMGTLVNLQALVLRNNNLTGELPLTLKNCSNLVLLDVSKNLLSGPVPSWIGESLQQLKILSLRVNHLSGRVHVHLCYLSQIQILDLSRNKLSGGIPTCLGNFTTMIERSVIPREILRKRKISTEESYANIYDTTVLLTWKGQENVFLNSEYLLKSIDLSSNELTGQVPKELGYLVGLVSLNLSRNNLSGEIPSGIGNLKSLDFLDLSRNHLSGKIPSALSKIDSLGKLDISKNDLSGRIPWEGHLQTFDASSFEGNVDLCGKPLNKSCPGDDPMLKPQGPAVDSEDDNSVFFEALYMSLGLGFFAGFWLLGPLLLWQPWRIAYVRFLNRLTDYIFVVIEVNIGKCHRWFKR